MKTYFLFITITLSSLGILKAQDAQKATFSLNADIVSRYVWRGLLYSASPNIQPYASVSKGQFTFGTWGSYSFNQNYSEVDFYIQWQYKRFGLTLNDYCTLSEIPGESKYFNFKNKETLHALEANASFVISENFPLKLLAATFFYGNDRDEEFKNLYSTYFEVSYPISTQNYEYNIFAGATPAKGLYGDKAGFANVGASAKRSIKINDNFSIPVSLQLSANPLSDYVFMVFSLTL